jgi:hypothetical protein
MAAVQPEPWLWALITNNNNHLMQICNIHLMRNLHEGTGRNMAVVVTWLKKKKKIEEGD